MDFNNKELAVYIGNKIKEFRKKKNYTQKELGELINKSSNTISRYETGSAAPMQDSLFGLAQVLDVKVDDFFPALKNGRW